MWKLTLLVLGLVGGAFFGYQHLQDEECFEYKNNRVDISMINVVTSSFHVLRSKMIARDLGREVSGIGASTLPYLVPTYYLREFFAVVEELIL